MNHIIAAIAFAFLAPVTLAGGQVDYLTQIKPLLSGRCYPCHSALRQQSGLRLDTAVLMIKGGYGGPAVVPGNSRESLVVSMVTGESGLRMPPEEEGAALSDEQITLLKQWIDEGANSPDEQTPPDPRKHWSFQPPERPAPPRVTPPSWNDNPIDAFLAAAHASRGVRPVEPADKATLLRRVYFDLIGLPPTPDELAAYLADDSPQAYEQVVDHLLASPKYGERWARHWMDVWRYSDWAGYEQEIRNSVRHIWRWRDWIIDSLNADKGYDQMVREMLAGDEIAPTDAEVLSATGYLARNWYKFNRNTWLDNTVEHTAKAFLGITMNCCRCHDHKYDPVSQVEYYQLRAVFEPHEVRTDRVPGEADLTKDGLSRVCDLKPNEPTYVFVRGNEMKPDKEHPLQPGVPAMLGGAMKIEPVNLPMDARYPALREFVVEEDVAAAARKVAECELARTKSQAAVAAAQQTQGSAPETNAAVKEAVAAAERASRELTTARAALESLRARVAAEKAKYRLSPEADSEQLARTAATSEGELALCRAQEQYFVAEQELTRARAVADPEVAKSRAALEAAENRLNEASIALATAHKALANPHMDYQPLGEVSPATSTGRRLAFANWVTDRTNPLTARVAVNHIWLRHFGTPLVDNMFDFGLRSPQPRNQPLLDWLAVELMENDWKMKHIHRVLVTSNAYRMKSDTSGANETNFAVDRDNKLLWRMNSRRLEAEAVRDALFFAADTLESVRGGPDIDCLAAADTPRRSIYFRHAYEKQMNFLEIYDSASTNECYRRSESVVPLQALALANSAVVIDQSRILARQLSEKTTRTAAPDRAFVQLVFMQILSRGPTEAEIAECLDFLKNQASLLSSSRALTKIEGGPKPGVEPSIDPSQRARENLTHVLFNHNDFVTIR